MFLCCGSEFPRPIRSVLLFAACRIPAGMHEVSFPVWRPLGTPTQELSSFFLGAHPMLKSSSVVFSTAPSERLHLVTTGTGTVHARFEIVFRNMEAYGVEW